jgi:dihydropyrimidinase
VQTPEDHLQCTRAALLGGTTTIVDFAIPRPGQSPLAAVNERLAAAREGSLADYALHGCFTDMNAADLDQIPEMVAQGVRSIKVYTTYRGDMMASDGLIRSVMEELLPHDGLTYVHAEDNSMIEALMAELGRGGPIPFQKILEARPESAEERAVERVLEIAEDVGAPVYFVHQSTPRATEMTRAARARGIPAYAEVCPHYATLDESAYELHRGECYTCCPPLRSRATVDALMEVVASGRIDTLASDHCAFDTSIKADRKHDLQNMPFGMPGVQTRMPVMLSELVCHRNVPMSTAVRLLCARPAQLSGIFPRKGVIAAGADADLIVWSVEGETTIDASDLAQASDYTPFEGWRVHGVLEVVMRGGRVVCRDGKIVEESAGRIIPSGPIRHRGLDAGLHSSRRRDSHR